MYSVIQDQDQQLRGGAFSDSTIGRPLQPRQIFPPRADPDRFAGHSTWWAGTMPFEHPKLHTASHSPD